MGRKGLLMSKIGEKIVRTILFLFVRSSAKIAKFAICPLHWI
jgi:hypothetical protein